MNQLKKEITLIGGIGQLSTTLLGTGLFMIPAIAAGIAGGASLWAWVILFVAVVPIALTFAALGKRYPNAGGTSYFVRKAFNAKIERSVAWLFLSVIPVGIPAGVALTASFGQQLLPGSISSPLLAEILTILLLTTVNLIGSKSSSRIQVVIALGICTLVSFLWLFGDVGSKDIVMPSLSVQSLPVIASALAVMFWCFVGIEAFAHMGEEFKNPERDFPVSIVLGCLFAGLIYWACTVVILKFHAYGTAEMDTASIPWLSEKLIGSKASFFISLLGYLACFASMNLYMQSLSRMTWSLAKKNRSDSRLAQLSSRGVPAHATLTIAVVLFTCSIIGELLHLDLAYLVKLANGVFILIYLFAMLAAYKLLTGIHKYLAAVALAVTAIVFACLQWAALYSVIVFLILRFVPQGYFTLDRKLNS